MDIFDLAAKLTLDSRDFEKGLEKTRSAAGKFATSIGKGLKNAAKIGAGALAAVTGAVTALSKGILDGTKELAAYGDSIDKASQKMGISAKAYQEWDAVLQHSGTSIDELQRGMITLAKAATKNADEFKQLGISEEELASLSQEDLFARVISGLQDMGEGAERTALASKLLGGSAKELGPLLNTSAADTKAMIDRVNELGGVMSDDAVKAAAAYQDALQDFQTAMSGTKRRLISDFMPSVTKVMDGLTDIFAGNSASGLAKLNKGINQFAKNLSTVIPKVLPVVGELVQSLGSAILDNADIIINAGVDLIVTLSNGLIKGLPQLVTVSVRIIKSLAETLKQNVRPLIEAFSAAITEIVALFEDPEFVREMIMLFVDLAVEIAKAIVDALPALIDSISEALLGLLTGLWDAIQELFGPAAEWFNANIVQPIIEFFRGLCDSVSGFFSDAWESIKGIWNSVASWFDSKIVQPIRNAFSGAWDALRKGASDAWTGIKNVFKSIPEWFKSKFRDAWQKVKDVFSAGGKIFEGIKDGIVSAFKAVVNAIIRGINKVIAIPFNAINDVLATIRDIEILGLEPFSWIRTFKVPQIPELARGGVVSAPTLAMIGEAGREAVVPLENNTGWAAQVAQEIAKELSVSGGLPELSDINDTLNAILDNMDFNVVLSDGVIAGRIDKILGRTARQKARGNA